MTYLFVVLVLAVIALGYIIYRQQYQIAGEQIDVAEEVAAGIRSIGRSLASITTYLPKTPQESALMEFLGTDTPQSHKIIKGMVPVNLLTAALIDAGWNVFKEYKSYSKEHQENTVCLFCEAPLDQKGDDYAPAEHRLVVEFTLSEWPLANLKSEVSLAELANPTKYVDIVSDCIIHFTTDCDEVCRTDMQTTLATIYKANKVELAFTRHRIVAGHIATQSYNANKQALSDDQMEYTDIPVSILNKSYSSVKIGDVERKAGDFISIFEKLHAKRKVNTLIKGGLGTGKTTLAKSLLHKVQNTAVIVVLAARQMEQLMAQGNVFQNMRTDAAGGKKYILFIDEAQNLTKETAAELAEIMDGKYSHENISIIISSDNTMTPEIEEVLTRPGRTHVQVNLHLLDDQQWRFLVQTIETEDPTKKWREGPTGPLSLAQIHNNFTGLSMAEDVEELTKTL